MSFLTLHQNHFAYLTSGGQSGLSVFVPLCGKSLDMVWLSDQGLSVVGCDISELAAQQFYTENSITVKKCKRCCMSVYSTHELYWLGHAYLCNITSPSGLWPLDSVIINLI